MTNTYMKPRNHEWPSWPPAGRLRSTFLPTACVVDRAKSRHPPLMLRDWRPRRAARNHLLPYRHLRPSLHNPRESVFQTAKEKISSFFPMLRLLPLFFWTRPPLPRPYRQLFRLLPLPPVLQVQTSKPSFLSLPREYAPWRIISFNCGDSCMHTCVHARSKRKICGIEDSRGSAFSYVRVP